MHLKKMTSLMSKEAKIAQLSKKIQNEDLCEDQYTDKLPSLKNSTPQAAIWSTFPYVETGRDVFVALYDPVPLSFSKFHHALDLLLQTE